MVAPSTYTESGLALYMSRLLGETATVLGLTEASFGDAVDDALLAYGTNVASIAEATDIPKLRALAKREAWRLAAATATGEFDYSALGSSFSRSQIRRHIALQLKNAEDDALAYDTGAGVSILAVVRPHDPYAPYEDSARGLP